MTFPRCCRPASWLLAVALLAWGALFAARPAWADPVELKSLSVKRGEDGVLLSFTAQFELPHPVEEALLKGVPLHFVAEASLYRARWYWRDVHVGSATRTWRLAYQPLTRKYRVSLGGLSQGFDDLSEALAVVRTGTDWKIAELSQLEGDGRHYVEFSYHLDTTQLPRPMQIGFSTQPEWTLAVERSVRLD